MSNDSARYGWESDFPQFRATEPDVIREQLARFVLDASPEQRRAWSDAIPSLQREVDEVLVRDALASRYSAILEYELPLEARRPDVILLVGSGVLVLELKGKTAPSQADLDQASAYARDLRCYHRECASRPVVPVLVPTRARGYIGRDGDVHIAGPDAIDRLVLELTNGKGVDVLDRNRFLDETAYRPLPTLVEAARELMRTGELRRIERAGALTDPALEGISRIIHSAAATGTRHMVLLTGVPGAGKTLVGLKVVHAHFLDDLAVERRDGRPTAPAVFLSGNGPLVEVLQYELHSGGGGGKTFVRGVKDYVKTYSKRPGLVPPEHVLVFDEAQRAFDALTVARKHGEVAGAGKSEPEHFIEFAERIPGWCVVIALIGSGQEIHVGEEGGLVQWRWAVERAQHASRWLVHGPSAVADSFANSAVSFERLSSLNLDTCPRQHLAGDLHRFVADLLDGRPASELRRESARLESCATEFYTQGLELDATLLAWGTDFRLVDGRWSIDRARGYREHVRDPHRLRLNAYRVLLTRGRDACVIFVPPLSEMDETYAYFSQLGFVQV